MFCSGCGCGMQAGQVVCPRCGRRMGVAGGGGGQSRLERHLRTLGTLWMVIGGLFLIPALGLLVFGRELHIVLHGQEPWPEVFQLLLLVASGTMLILAAGGVCVGLGLMQRAPWARTTAIILGVLALFHPPLGTALGAYSLWVLLADGSGEEYQHLAHAA